MPIPGTGRERNVVYDAGDAIECLQRAGVHLVLSGHKHVPYAWKLENLFVVNTGTVSTLRLRGHTRPCYNVVEVSGSHVSIWRRYPFPRSGADHPVRRVDRRVREVHGAHRARGHGETVMRAVALVDGEHYAPVVRDALRALPYEWVGAILVGGTEKLRDGFDIGVPLVDGFGDAEVVVDLSDEPVLGPAERFRWISRALAAGIAYVGADFRFDPPAFAPFELPSIAVIGTGKRVGKTAVTAHLARLLAREHDVLVVAMGRGGPPEPELVEAAADRRRPRRALARGRHAASDHLEVAALTGVTTIGCRRAGGGLAGAVFVSNVEAGARLAAARRPDVVVFDGSGAAIPPIDVDRRVLVVGRGGESDAYLNTYRRLISDVILSVGCDAEGAIRADLRLLPLEELTGRVAVFTAGATDAAHLAADVVHVSANLADRAALRRELEGLDADTYLVEVKAAAIDVVAEHALERGKRVVLAANELVGDGVDEALASLAPARAAG